MPSPPCDGGTRHSPPGTGPSDDDAVLRGSSGGGEGDGRGSADSAIGAAGDRGGEVNFWLFVGLILVVVGGVDHAFVIGGFDASLFKLRAL